MIPAVITGSLLVDLLVLGLIQGVLIAPMAMGFAITLGAGGFWFLGYGGAFLVSGYAAYELANAGTGRVVSMLGAMVAGALYTVLCEVCLHRVLRKRQVSPTVMFVSSLGLLTVVTSVIQILYSEQTVLINWGLASHVITFGPVVTNLLALVLVCVCIAALGLAGWWLLRTRSGRLTQAISEDVTTGGVVGIDVNRTRAIAFAVAGALTAPTAVAIGADTGLTPDTALNYVLIAATATILGGITKPLGAIVGCIVILDLETVGGGIWNTKWQEVFAFGVLILVILFRPTGFFGARIWHAHA
jgi:branched-subunit amino acid ABC-type transport system permease component